MDEDKVLTINLGFLDEKQLLNLYSFIMKANQEAPSESERPFFQGELSDVEEALSDLVGEEKAALKIRHLKGWTSFNK